MNTRRAPHLEMSPGNYNAVLLDHEPVRGGGVGGVFYPKVISGYLDHQSTHFRLSASELSLLHYMEFQIVMTLSLSNSFIMTKKAISMYCFIV